ncbi:ATP-binding cassette domain-containing protein [Nocardia sp. NPDC059177]|uniref:ATP-binding cassette domain-containing protein n=1 Tax=Nocardia sp. NPDC059177 TaxID=3346759 RepID=UPI0036A61CC5
MTTELRRLTVRIDNDRWQETVLAEVDLVVPRGRITAVLGGPGAGKTMLAAALTGRLPSTARCQGQVVVDGVVIAPDQGPLPEDVVGYVPQEGVAAFDSQLTVGSQFRASEQRHGAWTIERACAAAHYPVDALELLPGQHSGGQIQRAALAAALLPAPPILVADGPANSLDAGTSYGVWTSLRAYADSGAAVLAISNEVRLLTTGGFADHLVVLHEGRILDQGPTTHLAASPDPYVRALINSGR